jgi:hypothetical protein
MVRLGDELAIVGDVGGGRRRADTGTSRGTRRWPAIPMYELRYRYGASSEPAIEHADLNDDGQAAVRAVRELLGMPSRHAVEVRREGVLIFCRTRTRLVQETTDSVSSAKSRNRREPTQ